MPTLNGNQNGKKDYDFSGKKYKTLPTELLKSGGDAVRVDLQRNRLKQITGISQLTNLKELNLSRNEITDFPLEIRGLHQLEKLYLNQNSLKTIPENVFPSLGKLQFLKLSTNRLEKLPIDLNRCQDLTYLNLSNNCLKNLDPIVDLSHLKELYVERNQLYELPDKLFQNISLTLFKANGNPLRKPPVEVCTGGLKDIQSYFSMLEANAPHVYTVKTMFLGNSMAGKSTLCRSLEQGCPVPVEEADRTVGIDISEVDRDGIRFFFWDFAGQEEYYITHHVFITAQAFVILAINLSSYNMDEQSFKENVDFWIKNLQLKIPDSVVLLVGTHVDQCTETEVNEKKKHIEQLVEKMLKNHTDNLERRRKNLQDGDNPSLNYDQMHQIERLTEYKLKVLEFILIDCTKQEDIDRLLTRIKNDVLNKDTFPNIEKTLPRSYYDVEKDIQELVRNSDIPEHGIVSLNVLLPELKNRHDTLDDDKLKLILQYLHRIGVIMWYKEIPELAGSVFVKPSFLISLFKTIVRHDLVQELNKISSEQLKSENAIGKQKKRWISDYKDRASLNNVAIRILVRTELQKNYGKNDEELIEEVVGSSKKEGSLLSLLKHFDVCLSTKHNSPLNPKANEFYPKKDWVASNPIVFEPDACLFPNNLSDNEQVKQKWESDNTEDLNIHVYLLPEIPHGFFHRLVIRTCSLYSPYWIGKDQCMLCSGNKRFLLRERCDDEDQFIEIRCKESELDTPEDIQKAWRVIREIMKRLNTLTEQWQGLYQTVHSPCKAQDCDDYFEWNDWQEWLDDSGTNPFNVGLEGNQTCRNGHQRRTEWLLPRSKCIYLQRNTTYTYSSAFYNSL